jgi:hypothetical protein
MIGLLQEQRGELIQTLGQARNLIVEVKCSPAPLVRVLDGQQPLAEIRQTALGKLPSRARPSQSGGR